MKDIILFGGIEEFLATYPTTRNGILFNLIIFPTILHNPVDQYLAKLIIFLPKIHFESLKK